MNSSPLFVPYIQFLVTGLYVSAKMNERSEVNTPSVSLQELLPLVFMFELPITGVLQPVPDSSSPIVQQISNTYSVAVSFKQRPRVYVTTVVVRGSVDNAKAVKEATALLIENLTGNLGVSDYANNYLISLSPKDVYRLI